MSQATTDQTSPDEDYMCPVSSAMQVLGGKWKPIILWLLYQGTKRFNELDRMIPGVTQKMLTRHLRELEADGVIHREVYPVVPPKVEYSLTTKGRELEPVLLALADWGQTRFAKQT